MRFASAVLVLLVAIAAIEVQSPASAQSAPERLSLQLWRDSLSILQDSVILRRLERGTLVVARNARDNPLVHLRQGFVLLRLGEVGAGSVWDDAAAEFEWASELRPTWPYPWFGLGLAEAAAPNRARGFAGGLWTMLGIDRDRLAGGAFAQAVRADPTFIEGMVAFAQAARNQRIGAPLRPALDALRSATSSMVGWHPALLLERGRLERLVGDPDSARIAFTRAVALSLDPAVAEVELARTIPLDSLALTDPERRRAATERTYYLAAMTDNTEAVGMLRRDLEPILDDSTLRGFDATNAATRGEWLRRFWAAHGAADLRTGAARLEEQFRRWAVVRQEFILPPFKRRYRWGFELYRSGDRELDDRGIIWLRHGEPTVRVVWPRSRPAGRVDPLRTNAGNESWRYDRPEGTLVLHFVATDDEDDFRLVENALDLDVALDQLERRAHEFPDLARLIRSSPNSMYWVSEEERLRGRRSVAVATQSDSWERHYATLLTGRAQWLSAGARRGQALVHLIYTVDAEALRSLPGTGPVALTVRAVFLDAAGEPTAMLDTVQRLPRPPASAKQIAMRAELAAPAGAQKIRLGIEASPGLGVVYPIDSLVVPSVVGPQPALSALLVGRSPRSLPWSLSASDTAWLDATSNFASGDTLTVFAELYGLPEGGHPTVQLTIRRRRSALGRLFRPDEEKLTIGETLAGAGASVRWLRAVALGPLAPGDYILEFSAVVNGRRLVRQRGMVIKDRE